MRIRLDDDPFIDEIRVSIVPRFKTSGLSGDEWRFHVHCEALRKGRLVGERDVGNMRYAQAMMATGNWWTDHEAIPDPELTHDLCDQPGCDQPWTVLYRLVKRGCGTCGNRDRYAGDEQSPYLRAFCDRHAHRGNSDLDDSDDNYQPIEGTHPAEHTVRAEDESPSMFGGIFRMSEEPDS